MKEHSVSQSIAPPSSIPILFQPSVDELMTDWLAERVKRAIEIVIAEAPACNVEIREIHVFGFEYYDEPTRVIFVNPVVEATRDDAYEYWGVLADAFADLNRQPLPPGSKNTDVTVEITVDW